MTRSYVFVCVFMTLQMFLSNFLHGVERIDDLNCQNKVEAR